MAACTGDDAPATPRNIEISNGVGLMEGIDATRTTTLTGNCEIDGMDGSIECDGLVIRLNAPAVYDNIGYEVIAPTAVVCAGSDAVAPSISVFSFGSLAIAEGANIFVRGRNAIAIVAAGSIDIRGMITGMPGETGGFPGAYYDGFGIPELGPAPGADTSGETSGGAGGAGGLTAGGAGGNSAGGAGGALVPAQLEPLCGGSGGGMVADVIQGGGGGVVYGMGGGGGGAALLFAAAESITIDASGNCGVRADGVPGSGSDRGGPGGGAGGTLLFEAPTVTLGGSCTVSAVGGFGAASGTGIGGLGGDGVSAPQNGGPGDYGGGGGGAAGFVRVRVTTCPSAIAGFLPAPTCETLPTS